MTVVGFVAVAFCILGAVILSFYDEMKVMKTISKEGIKEANEF